jgi:serine/threonine-protein kinase RsbW
MATNAVKFRMTLSSLPKNIVRVEKFINKVTGRFPLDEIKLNKLMVSLTEAVNNAIVHGNKCDPGKKVTVVCEELPGWLCFVVSDEGRGFAPEKLANPLKSENLLRESGRGVFLMRTLMDRVEFESLRSGYQVRLWLDLSR